jgi:hypothetical protein
MGPHQTYARLLLISVNPVGNVILNLFILLQNSYRLQFSTHTPIINVMNALMNPLKYYYFLSVFPVSDLFSVPYKLSNVYNMCDACVNTFLQGYT